ncbi:hypothetical protein [Nocardia seriolae]|uniref:Uncharacterized protein n=1 Tax=Nocardia seriolae TaxID=37332 RepID=A0A0B8N0A9_9NOCA|nr:hypothetical protein [Nocardia seriolae]APA95219.1 hypothetical protein NS506_01146 [Nocardia seriolae]MTJ66686.1 hypothetical protein [Nocardia seriolae]MTJ72092.1 hypothetical protein [Nocardia seriolae]MTJ85475.1 hypothetical protein [Nocardia seriolae]MTK29473.1 hypothetical protein [Nocardia seriolae]
MVALLVSFLIVAAFAAIVYRYAPKSGERWGVLLERYRPHAPMSDWSLAEYEAARQYSDLAAIAALRPDACPPGPVRRLRRPTPAVAALAHIPCRGESVQF